MAPLVSPAAVLKAAEHQDWTALSRLVPLEPAIAPTDDKSTSTEAAQSLPEQSAISDVAAAAAAGDAAGLLQALGTGASDVGLAGFAVGDSFADPFQLSGSSVMEEAVKGGMDAYRDPETGMHALHWLARHGRLQEADFIAPLADLLAQAHERDQAAFAELNATGSASSDTTAATAPPPPDLSLAKQRLDGGPWKDFNGYTPLHHMAYNNGAATHGEVAQELVAELVRATKCDLDAKDDLGGTPMHTAAATANAKVVMALLWMGADPYVLDSYGNTPKTTAEAFDHLKIAVGLQAVAKKETELAQALNVYDEVERGVERAEAFRVAVSGYLESHTEESEGSSTRGSSMDHSQKEATTDSDQNASSSTDLAPAAPTSSSIGAASAVAAKSGAFWDDLGQRISTSPMPPIEASSTPPIGATTLSQSEDKVNATTTSADSKPEKHETDRPTKGETPPLSAESTVADIHKLANAIAVLESKVDVSSSRREKALKELNDLGHTFSSKVEVHKRADADLRSGGASSKRSSSYDDGSDIWGANAAANEAAIKLAEAAASFGVILPTVLPTVSLSQKTEDSSVNDAKEEEKSASTFAVPEWGAMVQKLSENDIGKSMLASGGFFDSTNADSTFDSSGQVIGDNALAQAKVKGNKKTQAGSHKEDNEQSGQFLTPTEWAEMQELESSRLLLLAQMSERDERRAMGDEDYEAHVAREVVLQAQYHPLTRSRALHALPHQPQFEEKVDSQTSNYSSKRKEEKEGVVEDDDEYDGIQGEGVDRSVFAAAQRRVRSLVSGLAPKSPWASQDAHKQALATATAQAYESDEARAEAQLQRHAQARSWDLAAVPTSAAVVQSPLVTIGSQASNSRNYSNFVRPNDAQTEALVARALEAEYAAEKRALKTSLVSDRAPGGLGRANAAGHRASSIQAQEGRVLPSDELRRRNSAAAGVGESGGREAAAAELAKQRELRLSASQRAGAGGIGAGGGDDKNSSSDSASINAPFASQFGGSLAASAHEETMVLAQSLASSDASGRGGVSTGAFAGLLPQASDRLRYSTLKHNNNSAAVQASKVAPSSSSTSSSASTITADAAAAAVAGGSSAAALLRKDGALGKSKFSVDALTFAAAASAAVAKREPSLKLSENEDDSTLPAQPLSGWDRASGKKASYDNTVAGRVARAEAAAMVADQASGATAVAAAANALDSALAESRDVTSGGGGADTAEARLLAKRAEDPIQRLSKKARDDLRSQFELYVPKKIEDPYSLDFLKKKRGPAAVATIPEKDLRTAVTALGWHTLSDAEVAEFATVIAAAEPTKRASSAAAGAGTSGENEHDPIASAKALAADLEAAVEKDAMEEEAAEKAKAAMGLKRKPASFRERKRQQQEDEEEEAKKKAAAEAAAAAAANEESEDAGWTDSNGAHGTNNGESSIDKAATTGTTPQRQGRTLVEKRERRTWHANFNGFIGLLARKTFEEEKLSKEVRQEFEEGFGLFVDSDEVLETAGWSKNTISVQSVAVLCSSLDHPLSDHEVEALALASYRGACFKQLKKADKGVQARAATDEMARAFEMAGQDVDNLIGFTNLRVDKALALRTYARKLMSETNAAALEAAKRIDQEAVAAAIAKREAEARAIAEKEALAAKEAALRSGITVEGLMARAKDAQQEMESTAQSITIKAKEASAAAALVAKQTSAQVAKGQPPLAAISAFEEALKLGDYQKKEEEEKGVTGESKEGADEGAPSGDAQNDGTKNDDDEEEEIEVYQDEEKAAAAKALARQEARLKLFVDAFDASTEASYHAHTSELRTKEQARLQHAARALKPLLVELEEDAQGGRAAAAMAAASAEERRRSLQAKARKLRQDTPQARLMEAQMEAEAAALEAQAAALGGLSTLSTFWSTAVSQATGQALKKKKKKKSATKESATDNGVSSSSSDVKISDSKNTEQAAAGAEEGGNATINEEKDEHEGFVWDEDEGCWVPSEEAAKKEVARAQEWAEDLTRDHLMWYLEEFPSSTYEDWIAAFAPENAREYLAGRSPDVDHRFYFPAATHLRLWNSALEVKDPEGKRAYLRVAPRNTLPHQVTQ